MQKIILAIDTSGNNVSLALSNADKILAYGLESRAGMQAECIFPMLNTILSHTKYNYSDIDYIAVSRGPGSFTGTRIGCAVAKAISLSIDKKVIGITNLVIHYNRALSQIKNYDKIIIFLNAFRQELYMQIFNKNGEESIPELVTYNTAYEMLSTAQGTIICAGDGVPMIYETIKNIPNLIILLRFHRLGAVNICRYANKLLENNKDIIVEEIEPLYIRPPDAKNAKNFLIH